MDISEQRRAQAKTLSYWDRDPWFKNESSQNSSPIETTGSMGITILGNKLGGFFVLISLESTKRIFPVIIAKFAAYT